MNGNLKRVLSLLLVVLMLFTVAPVESIAVSAELVQELITDGNILYGETVDSGSFNTGVSWTFYEDGTLRISGEGDMPGFLFSEGPYEGSEEYINFFEDIDGEDMTPYLPVPEEITVSDSTVVQSFMSAPDTFSLTAAEEEEAEPTIVPWADFALKIKKVVVEEGVTSVGDYAFTFCINITEVVLADSVSTIGEYAFAACIKLEKINLENVVTVCEAAFAYSFMLEKLSLDSVVTIENTAFYYNLFLKEIKFGDSLQAIEGENFGICLYLKEIDLPASLTTFDWAFYYTFSLEKITNRSLNISVLEDIDIIGFDSLATASEAAFIFAYMSRINILAEVFDLGNFYNEGDAYAYLTACYNKHFGTDYTVSEILEYTDNLENNFIEDFPEYLKIYCYEDSAEHTLCSEYGISHTLIGESSEHLCYDFSGTTGDITWSVDYDTKVLTLSGSGAMEDYDTAPWFRLRNHIREIEFAEDSAITYIGDSAFYGLNKVKSVAIPDTVSAIGDDAFYECRALTSVTFEEGSQLKTIGNNCFSYCSNLSSITIPASVTDIGRGNFRYNYKLSTVAFEEGSKLENIGESSFYYCQALEAIELPASLVSVGNQAFYYCTALEEALFAQDSMLTTIGDEAFYCCENLKSIEIPASVTSIGGRAFRSCSSLEDIAIAEGNTAYCSENGILYNADKTTLIACPAGKTGAVEISASATRIDDYSFYECEKITSVSFAEDSCLSNIDYQAFYSCKSLTEISLPLTVSSIDSDAFRYCESLKRINVAQGSTYFCSENGILYNADKTRIIFCPYAYEGEIVIPAGVNYLNSSAFEGRTKITSVSFEENAQLYSIPYYAFRNCTSLKAVTLPASIRYVDDSIFYGCTALENVIFEDGIELTEISYAMFRNCTSLKSITIPSSVSRIDWYAFYGCSSLESIVIPEAVTNIEYYAFNDCEALQEIKILNRECTVYDSSDTIPKNTTIIGYTDSAAQDYAEKYDRTFESLDNKTLESISVKNGPYRSIYYKGFGFKADGLTIYLNYSDGTQSEKTSGFDITGYKSSVVGKQTITVSYKGFTDTFEITVRDYLSPHIEPGLSVPIYAEGSYEYTYVEFIPEVSGRYGFAFSGAYGQCKIADKDKNYLTSHSNGSYGKCYYDMTAGTKYYLGVCYSSDSAGYITGTLTLENNECSHENTEKVPEMKATCTADGRTSGIRCTDCKVWLSGGDFIHSAHTDVNIDRICEVCSESTLLSSGLAGDNINWFFYDNGDLEFVGSGDMWDFENTRPWQQDSAITGISTKNIIVGDGITSIGKYVLNSDVDKYIIPTSVVKIGPYLSMNSEAVFLYIGTQDQWNAIEKDFDSDRFTIIYNYRYGEDITGTCGENITWTLDYSGKLTVEGEGEMADAATVTDSWLNGYAYLIKEVVISEGVTSVGSGAFRECRLLEKVTLADTVTKIGENAFYNCRGMNDIKLSSALQTIGGRAFYWCYNLKSIDIPDSVTQIGSCAFEDCSGLTFVVLPKNLTAISEGLFESCSLTDIVIPSCVTSIGNRAFSYCDFKNLLIPDSVTYIGNDAFYYCTDLEEVTLSSNITAISDYMFYECSNLKSIVIPEGVISIGACAFYYCDDLTEISLPETLTTIGSHAFHSCGFSRIELPDSLIRIEGNAFEWCDNLEEITIPENVTSIGSDAFRYCRGLTSLTIPESVTSVGSYVIDYCENIKSVTFLNPDCSVYYLGNSLSSDLVVRGYYGSTAANLADRYGYTFVALDTSMTHDGFEYIIDENGNATVVGYEGEETEVVIPAEIEGMAVTAFDRYAFKNKENITSVEIPDTIGTIPNNALRGCTNLKKVIVNGMETVGNTSTWFAHRGMYIYGHRDSAIMNQIISDGYAGEFISLDVDQNPDRETTADDFLWRTLGSNGAEIYGYIGTPSVVTIPETIDGYNVVSVGNGYNTFERDTRIESVYIPKTVKEVDMYGHFTVVDEDNESFSSDEYGNLYNKDKTVLYHYCVNNEATEYTVPETVTGISNYAFYDADNLQSVIFPENVVNINGYQTFMDCNSITDITVYNPQCSFASYLNINSNPRIHAHKKTQAESYANSYGRTFISLCDDYQTERIDTPCGKEKIKVTYCSVCSYEISRVGTGEFTEHTFGEWETIKEPTCTEDGYELYVCTVCGETQYKETEDGDIYYEVLCDSSEYPESPHNYGNSMTYEYEFTHPYAKSLTLKFSSSSRTESCDYIYIYDSEDNLVGTYSGYGLGGKVINVNGDTFKIRFKTDGSVVYYGFSFESIKAVMSDFADGYYNILPALGHDMPEEWVIAYYPTCTDDGSQYKICSRCDYFITEYIPALGHDFSEEFTVDTEVTCTVNGSKSKHCSRCEEKSEVTVIPAPGHDPQEDWTVIREVTCTEDGYEIKLCSRCGIDLAFNGVVCDPSTYPETPHPYSNSRTYSYNFSYPGAVRLILNFSSSTVVENNYDKIYIYDSTGALYGRYTGSELQNAEILLEGNGFKIELTTDYSVTNYGFSFDSIAAVMGDENPEYCNVITAPGHDMDEEFTVSMQASCTESGTQYKTCSRCNYFITEDIPALGHDFSEEFTVDKEPTCTVNGSKSKHCSRCTAKDEVTVIDALGHDMSGDFILDWNATCTQNGSMHKKCSRCNYFITEAIPALGHDFSEEFTVDKEPTCTVNGSKSKHCSRCSEKDEVTVIDALGHDMEEEFTVDRQPDCTADGSQHKDCLRCTYKETETIPALGHDFSEEFTADKEPTCTVNGSKSKHCSRCTAKDEVTVIDALGHNYPDEWTVVTEVSCTEDGYKYKKCTRCNNKTEERETAYGHNYESEAVEGSDSEEKHTRYTCLNCGDVYVIYFPAIPVSNLVSIGQKFRVELSWLRAIEYTVTGYNIYRKTADSEEFELIASVNGRDKTAYVDYDVEVGTEYFYQVAAVKNTVVGEMSETVSGIPQPDTEKPNVVTFVYNGTTVNNTISKTAAFRFNTADDTAIEKCELEYAPFGTEEWSVATSKKSSSGTISMDTTILADGHYSFRLKAYDTSGNYQTSVVDHMVDNTAPGKVNGLRLVELYASKATLTWDDVTSGDRHYFIVRYKTDGEYIEVGEQIKDARGYYFKNLQPSTEYTCSVAAVDFYGNVGEYSDDFSFVTAEDTTAPVITKLTPISSRYNKTIPFEATAEDDIGIAKVVIQVSVDGEEWFNVSEKLYDGTQKSVKYSLNVDLDEYDEGIIYLRANATDTSGNESDSKSFVQYYVDKTPPAVPDNVTADSFDGYIEIKWDKNTESDILSYRLYRSDAENGTYTLIAKDINYTNAFDRNTVRGKEYFYKLTSVDTCGNESDFSEVVSVIATEDDKAPEILSISPADGKIIGANTNRIGVLAEDNASLESVVIEYRNTSGNYIQLVSSTNVSDYYKLLYAYIPTDEFSDGDKITVRSYCTDTAGHKSDYKEASYTVDKEAPEIADFTVNVNENKCTVSWKDCGEDDVYSYTLYESIDSGAYKAVGTLTAEKDGIYEVVRTQTVTGVYSYRVVSLDSAGNEKTFESSKVSVTVPAGETEIKLNPVISGPNVFEVGVEERFTAEKSTADYKIVSYHWDYGDGTSSDASAPIKSYSTAGEYTVTLTVTDSLGNSKQTSMNVTVEEREMVGIVKVKVTDEDGDPISGVGVFFDYSQPTQNVIGTNSNGIASMKMSVGMHEIVAYGNNYLPSGAKVSVLAGETTEVELQLTGGEIATGDFEVKEMTLDEIKAAGIDISAPENQVVYEVKVTFIYGDKPYTAKTNRPANPDPYKPKPMSVGAGTGSGGVGGGGAGGGGGGGSHGPSFYHWTDSKGEDYVAAVEVPIKASYLKQFYSAKLTVMNHAAARFCLTNCRAGISGGGSGLTLVSRDSMPDIIPGGSTGSATWIYRGDSVGTYTLSASFSSELDNSGVPITLSFPSQSVEVYDIDTVKLRIEISEELSDGNLYMNVALVNQRPVKVNCPQIEVGEYVKNVLSEYKTIKKKENENKDDEDKVEIPEQFDIELKATRLTGSEGQSDILSAGSGVTYLEPGQSLVNEYIIKNVGFDGATGSLVKSIVECAGDYDQCIEIGHIGDTPIYVSDDEYVKEHENFIKSADYNYMKYNFAKEVGITASKSAEYKWDSFIEFNYFKSYDSLILTEYLLSSTSAKQMKEVSKAKCKTEHQKVVSDIGKAVYDFVKQDEDLIKKWTKISDKPEEINKILQDNIDKKVKGIFVIDGETKYDSSDYKLLEMTMGKMMDSGTLEALYRGYDLLGKGVSAFNNGVDCINTGMKIAQYVSIVNAYKASDESFKKVFENMQEGVSDHSMKDTMQSFINADLDVQSYREEIFKCVMSNGGKLMWDKFGGVLEDLVKDSAKKLLGDALSELPETVLSHAEIGEIIGAIGTGIKLGKIASKILANTDDIAAQLKYLVTVGQAAEGAEYALLIAEEEFRENKNLATAQAFDAAYNSYKSWQMMSFDKVVEYNETKNNATAVKILHKDKFADELAANIAARSRVASIYCHNPQYKVASQNTEVKAIKVECPVDVSVYSADNELLARVTDTESVSYNDEVSVAKHEGMKLVAFPADREYKVSISAYDDGSMDYTVYEFDKEGHNNRQIFFDDIPLDTGDYFNGIIDEQQTPDAEVYKLLKNDTEEVLPDNVFVYEVTGITLDAEEYNVKLGDTFDINVSVMPENADNKAYTITVGDESILQNNGDGTFTALKEGDTTIKVVTDDGGYFAQAKVKVDFICLEHNPQQTEIIPATCITEGHIIYECSACGVESSEVIPVDEDAHGEISVRNGFAATCTEDGYSGDDYCTLCNEVLKYGEVIECLGHTDTDSDNHCDICETVIDENLTTEPSVEDTTDDVTQPEDTTADITEPSEDKPSSSTTVKPTETTTKPDSAVTKPTVTVPSSQSTTDKTTTTADSGEKEEAEKPKAKKPAKVKLKKVKSLKNGKVSIIWARVKNSSGYQVSYSTSKKFKKKATKFKLIKKAKTTKTTLKKLKRGKKYFVKIRAYKTVNKKKLYGAWSKVKTVKVR